MDRMNLSLAASNVHPWDGCRAYACLDQETALGENRRTTRSGGIEGERRAWCAVGAKQARGERRVLGERFNCVWGAGSQVLLDLADLAAVGLMRGG